MLTTVRAFYRHETKDTVSFVSTTSLGNCLCSCCSCTSSLSFVFTHSSTGRPAYDTFPITNISVTVRDPDVDATTTLNERQTTDLSIEGDDLRAALQYGQTNGIVALRELLVDFQSEIHKREKGDWGVVMGNGAQDLIWKVSIKSKHTLTDRHSKRQSSTVMR